MTPLLLFMHFVFMNIWKILFIVKNVILKEIHNIISIIKKPWDKTRELLWRYYINKQIDINNKTEINNKKILDSGFTKNGFICQLFNNFKKK